MEGVMVGGRWRRTDGGGGGGPMRLGGVGDVVSCI